MWALLSLSLLALPEPADLEEAKTARRARPEQEEPRVALYFAPMSLFSLTLWIEADVHLAKGLSVFANVGGGPLGVVGGDLGVRYSVTGEVFRGFFVEARGSVFALPANPLVLMGPGIQIGHGWRIGHFALSIGAGFTTWYSVVYAPTTSTFFGSAVSEDTVIVFPGLSQPPPGQAGVAPTLRVSIGPTF